MAITEWELHRATVGQNKLHVLLCDDDPDFRNVLDDELTRIFRKHSLNASIVLTGSPSELSPELLANCDIAFLDIDFESEEQNGIDIARTLRQVNRRALIFFVTNYIDYAPAGYEVQAFRYILKRDIGEVLERYILQAVETVAEGKEYLQLRDQERVIRLTLEEITYLEVLDHYVSIYVGERSYTLGATLSSMEQELESHGFLRIHKSYLVNMRCICKFSSRECVLTDGTVLATSAKNYAQQKQKYLMWKVLK